MSKSKSVRYQSVSLAVPFIKEIQKLVDNNPKYRSIADYVRQAIREKMENEEEKLISWGPSAYKIRNTLLQKKEKIVKEDVSVEDLLNQLLELGYEFKIEKSKK